MRFFWAFSLIALAAGPGCGRSGPPAAAPAEQGFAALEPGLELGVFLASQPAAVGDGRIRVLRVDPRRFELRLLTASGHDGRPRTARQWAEAHDLVAATNAGMYQADHLTSVSLMRTREHVNNPRLTRDRAVLAFDPADPAAPPVKIIDRDCEAFDDWAPRYGSFVQSIRMLSCDGQNVWQQQERRWSTAAIGVDDAGRVLFVHARSPYSTHDLIDMLVALPLGLHSLMYAEGGPEAQLFVRGAQRDLEFVGSFEAATSESENNERAWPVPNVVGVVRRTPAG